jgi:hypothetical protein
MIENYKNQLINYHNRFVNEFSVKITNLAVQGKIDHEQMAREVRNWMLETKNILQYNPIFNPEPNTINSLEEQQIFDNFIADVKESIKIWKKTMSNYSGGMSKKLAESFSDDIKFPTLNKSL